MDAGDDPITNGVSVVFGGSLIQRLLFLPVKVCFHINQISNPRDKT